MNNQKVRRHTFRILNLDIKLWVKRIGGVPGMARHWCQNYYCNFLIYNLLFYRILSYFGVHFLFFLVCVDFFSG